MPGKGTLSDTQIEHEFAGNTSFGGVYDKTTIQRRRDKAGKFFVVNLESGPPGTHWCLLDCRAPNHVVWFDPFGFPPPNGTRVDEYNQYAVQGIDSSRQFY